jgi:sec-independent protein translocase protein TatC
MTSPQPGEMSLFEHLGELRTRLVRIAIAITLGGVIGWFVFEPVFDFLSQPYCALPGAYRPDGECALIVTRVLEAFSVRVRVSLTIGLFLATPVLFHQIWRFITPGLTGRERRLTLPFVIGSVIMFALGAGFAFFVIPQGLTILLRMGGDQIATLLSAAEYFSFVLTIVVVFGLVFQVPLIVVFLSLIGVVDTDQLRRFRAHAIVANCVIAAIATPADVVTMVMMAVPMALLYEAAIIAAWGIERSRKRRAPTEGDAAA